MRKKRSGSRMTAELRVGASAETALVPGNACPEDFRIFDDLLAVVDRYPEFDRTIFVNEFGDLTILRRNQEAAAAS